MSSVFSEIELINSTIMDIATNMSFTYCGPSLSDVINNNALGPTVFCHTNSGSR